MIAITKYYVRHGTLYEKINIVWGMELYDVELIPANELEERVSKLGISPGSIEMLIETGEPVYVAHNVTVEIIPIEPISKNHLYLEGI